jgi:hypothetical protein
LTDNISNQFLATWSKLDDIRSSNSSEFPFIDILDGGQKSVDGKADADGTDNYMALGYELFTYNNAGDLASISIFDEDGNLEEKVEYTNEQVVPFTIKDPDSVRIFDRFSL